MLLLVGWLGRSLLNSSQWRAQTKANSHIYLYYMATKFQFAILNKHEIFYIQNSKMPLFCKWYVKNIYIYDIYVCIEKNQSKVLNITTALCFFTVYLFIFVLVLFVWCCFSSPFVLKAKQNVSIQQKFVQHMKSRQSFDCFTHFIIDHILWRNKRNSYTIHISCILILSVFIFILLSLFLIHITCRYALHIVQKKTYINYVLTTCTFTKYEIIYFVIFSKKKKNIYTHIL